ncbi:MAG: ribosome silencing factor [Rhodospirillaceae bacterium]|nr:ribosome silencing factor [Rhodospirillaceae bacterium]
MLASLDADKGQDIQHLDVTGKTSIADRMIVASGTSTRQVSAMAEHLVTKLKSLGVRVRSEGQTNGDWVLVDAGDVIVHIFRPEVRAFYSIEKLWAATPVLKATPAAAAKPAKAKGTKAKAAKPPARKSAKKGK